MATKTITTCDIKGCSEKGERQYKGFVVFETEQNEGRAVEPYEDKVTIDLCKKHFAKFIVKFPIRATGAMGYNEFTMK